MDLEIMWGDKGLGMYEFKGLGYREFRDWVLGTECLGV